MINHDSIHLDIGIGRLTLRSFPLSIRHFCMDGSGLGFIIFAGIMFILEININEKLTSLLRGFHNCCGCIREAYRIFWLSLLARGGWIERRGLGAWWFVFEGDWGRWGNCQLETIGLFLEIYFFVGFSHWFNHQGSDYSIKREHIFYKK